MKFFHIILHLLRKKVGFYCETQLPQGEFISHGSSTFQQRWFCTDDFKYSARNHCAAVCIMNALLYFDQSPAFRIVHPLIGNGPVFSLRKARCWFSMQKIHDTMKLEAVLAEGKICAMMIATPLHEWHWVLITAIRKYPDGSRWLQIADGWHSNDLRYYRLEQEHDWISCTTLELK